MSQEFPTAQMTRHEKAARESQTASSKAGESPTPATTTITRESLEVSAFYDCLLRAYGGSSSRRRDHSS